MGFLRAGEGVYSQNNFYEKQQQFFGKIIFKIFLCFLSD